VQKNEKKRDFRFQSGQLRTNNGGRPYGGGWALRAGIGMTINLPGQSMSVTQCYLAMNDTHVILVVYTFVSFPSD